MDIQVNLYRISRLHPDHEMRAWAWAELRDRWHRLQFPRGNR